MSDFNFIWNEFIIMISLLLLQYEFWVLFYNTADNQVDVLEAVALSLKWSRVLSLIFLN